jgi:hypothetical protein
MQGVASAGRMQVYVGVCTNMWWICWEGANISRDLLALLTGSCSYRRRSRCLSVHALFPSRLQRVATFEAVVGTSLGLLVLSDLYLCRAVIYFPAFLRF